MTDDRPEHPTATATPATATTLALTRPPLLTAGWRFLLVSVALIDLLEVVPRLVEQHERGLLAWDLSGLAALVLMVVGGRALARPRVAPPVELGPSHALLPTRPGGRQRVAVPYRDVLSILLRVRGDLMVGTHGRLFVFPAGAFVDPEAAAQLAYELRARIAALPDGEQLLAAMDRRDDLARDASAQRPRATRWVLALCVAGYIVEQLTRGLDSPFGLVRLGANAPALVRDGQWFRLVSATFLHGGLLHLYLNGIALYSLGTLLEVMLGSDGFALVYLVSGGVAALASTALGRAPLSVGASGAIFGLLGALAAIHLRFRRDLPAGFRQPLRWWVFILAINGGLPLLVPQIDVAAHAGGFLAGLALTLALTTGGSIGFDASWRRRQRVPALIVVALSAAALGRAVVHSRTSHPDEELRVAAAFAASARAKPEALNELAWTWATDPHASPAVLEVARQAAARAVAEQPREPQLQDTLATVEYRLGRLDAAIARESALLDGGEGPEQRFYAGQLARFLAHADPPPLPPRFPDGGALYRIERSDGVPTLVRQCVAPGGAPAGGAVWIGPACRPVGTQRFAVDPQAAALP
jgi:rhomboid protease GluP